MLRDYWILQFANVPTSLSSHSPCQWQPGLCCDSLSSSSWKISFLLFLTHHRFHTTHIKRGDRHNVVKMQGSQRLSNVSRNGFSQAVPWSCHKVSDQTCLSLNWNWKHLGWKAIYSKASAISIGRLHKPQRTRQHALEQARLERYWCNRCFCCIFSSWIQNRKLQLLPTTLPRPCKYSL